MRPLTDTPNWSSVDLGAGERSNAVSASAASLSSSSGLPPLGFPKLDVQPASPFKELARVPIRERPGHGDLRGTVEKRFAVVGLDRRMALLTSEPVAISRVDPRDDSGAAEVTPLHDGHTIEQAFVFGYSTPAAQRLRGPLPWS
jgi:hypothetical protein